MDHAARGPSAVVRVALLVATACLVTGAASCTRDDDPTPGPTATLTTSPARSTTTTTIEDVEAAYLAAFEAYYDAVEHPEKPNDLASTHAGRSLERAESYVAELASKDQRATFPDGRPSAKVLAVSVDEDSAVVEACEKDSAVLVEVPGDQIIDDDALSSRTRAALRLDDSGWRLVDLNVNRTWNDALGCRG
ncbi:MAG: hypothetical protein KF906_01715 [Actinobacteria bacterium]|nr:hypothetical protein [Actinomycetota bacterium]